MTAARARGFDQVAPAYQDLWSETKAGRLQREAVWQHAADLFAAGSRVLDLGCGTGDDALMLAERGVKVTGIDSSPEMVRIACERGVNARVCAIENVGAISETFDAVWSNFGALNCVKRLADLRQPLSQTVKPGGWLVVCLMSRVCLRETFWYLRRGHFGKATRRWSGQASSSVVSRVFYPTIRAVRRAFAPDFKLTGVHGIGVAVPPSFVTGISNPALDRLGDWDRQMASLPMLRSLGDHCLLIFRRGAREPAQ